MEKTPLPPFLYKYRTLNGLAEYRQIKGNLYEDTTCQGHTNCRITIKRGDGYFDVNGLENDSAKEYDYFHNFVEGDSHLYADKKSPYIEVYSCRIENNEKKIKDNEAKIKEYEEKLRNTSLMKSTPQTISSIDYDADIILLHKKNKIISSAKVIEKVFNKNGLAYLNTNCEHKVSDTDDKKYLDVVLLYTDFEYSDYEYTEVKEQFFGFLSKEDMDVYLHNEIYYDLISSIETCKKENENSRERIKVYKEQLEEIKNKEI